MRILRAADHRAMPWKNGGGTTFEIAASPEGSSIEDFDWRVSRALVAQPGAFSAFPGIDRNLSVIAGYLTLTAHDGTRIDLSPMSMPFVFPGEMGIDGLPQNGVPVMDFNVMTRRGRYRSSVHREAIDERAVTREIRNTTLMLVEVGKLTIAGRPGPALGPLDCLLLNAGDSVTVRSESGIANVLITGLARV